MRQAGEVTYADCHKERRGEGYVCFVRFPVVLKKISIHFSESFVLNMKRI